MTQQVRIGWQQAKRLFRGYVFGDETQLSAARWFRDPGNEERRLAYPLGPLSVVIDCGGYEGDWAQAIHERYGSLVHVFEPVPAFARDIASRFSGNNKVQCHAYGLQGADQFARIHLDANASSVYGKTGSEVAVELRDVVRVLHELDLQIVDLIKINIEGGEYDLLERLVSSNAVQGVRYIQVQFHDFVPNAKERREAIRTKLRRTHELQWDFPFIWESWRRRESL